MGDGAAAGWCVGQHWDKGSGTGGWPPYPGSSRGGGCAAQQPGAGRHPEPRQRMLCGSWQLRCVAGCGTREEKEERPQQRTEVSSSAANNARCWLPTAAGLARVSRCAAGLSPRRAPSGQRGAEGGGLCPTLDTPPPLAHQPQDSGPRRTTAAHFPFARRPSLAHPPILALLGHLSTRAHRCSVPRKPPTNQTIKTGQHRSCRNHQHRHQHSRAPTTTIPPPRSVPAEPAPWRTCPMTTSTTTISSS